MLFLGKLKKVIEHNVRFEADTWEAAKELLIDMVNDENIFESTPDRENTFVEWKILEEE